MCSPGRFYIMAIPAVPSSIANIPKKDGCYRSPKLLRLNGPGTVRRRFMKAVLLCTFTNLVNYRTPKIQRYHHSTDGNASEELAKRRLLHVSTTKAQIGLEAIETSQMHIQAERRTEVILLTMLSFILVKKDQIATQNVTILLFYFGKRIQVPDSSLASSTLQVTF